MTPRSAQESRESGSPTAPPGPRSGARPPLWASSPPGASCPYCPAWVTRSPWASTPAQAHPVCCEMGPGRPSRRPGPAPAWPEDAWAGQRPEPAVECAAPAGLGAPPHLTGSWRGGVPGAAAPHLGGTVVPLEEGLRRAASQSPRGLCHPLGPWPLSPAEPLPRGPYLGHPLPARPVLHRPLPPRAPLPAPHPHSRSKRGPARGHAPTLRAGRRWRPSALPRKAHLSILQPVTVSAEPDLLGIRGAEPPPPALGFC